MRIVCADEYIFREAIKDGNDPAQEQFHAHLWTHSLLSHATNQAVVQVLSLTISRLSQPKVSQRVLIPACTPRL
jgi:hypothetical protein